jgi:hypothetical protein
MLNIPRNQMEFTDKRILWILLGVLTTALDDGQVFTIKVNSSTFG